MDASGSLGRWLRCAGRLLAAGIAAATVACAFHYRLDFPFWDSWELVPLLRVFRRGDFQAFIVTLETPHNGHVLFFPRLLLVLLADGTHWLHSFEVGANVFFAVLTFAGLYAAFRNTLRWDSRRLPWWIVPLLALLTFNLSAWRDWHWGWQVQFFMNTAFVAWAVALFTMQKSNAAIPYNAFFLGFLGARSLGAGPWSWFALIPALTAWAGVKWRICLKPWLYATGLFVFVFILEVIVLGEPSTRPNLFTLTFGLLLYVPAYLGAPAAYYRLWASVLAGLGGLAAWAFLVRWLWRSPIARRAWFTFLSLSLYGLGSAGLSALARYEGLLNQATSSRYHPLAAFFWVGLVGMCGVVLAKEAKAGLALRKTVAGGLVALTLSLGLSWRHGYYMLEERWRWLQPAKQALITGENPEMLERLYPVPAEIGPRIEYLRENRLSVFRGLPPLVPDGHKKTPGMRGSMIPGGEPGIRTRGTRITRTTP